MLSHLTTGTDRIYDERLTRLLDVADDISLRQRFGDEDDQFWLWLFTDGAQRYARVRALLPSMPSEEIQRNFTGVAGDDALRLGFWIYQLARSLAQTHVPRPIADVLDFGCGWGRITRFFLRDIEPARLWGVDCLPEMIDLCRETNTRSRFERIDPLPPALVAGVPIPDDSFDLIYAYSVFSHLSESAHLHWLREFARILRPGGLLVASTRPRDFVLTCQRIREAQDTRNFMLGAVLSFVDTDAALAAYDRGEYLYEPTGGGEVLDKSIFGETCIPKAYVLDRWTQFFEFIEYIDCRTDTRAGQQDVIVVRK